MAMLLPIQNAKIIQHEKRMKAASKTQTHEKGAANVARKNPEFPSVISHNDVVPRVPPFPAT